MTLLYGATLERFGVSNSALNSGEGQRETTLTGRPSGSPEDGWMLTARHDTDYLLRGRQPLRQDPWHRSDNDCPGPRPTDTTAVSVER